MSKSNKMVQFEIEDFDMELLIKEIKSRGLPIDNLIEIDYGELVGFKDILYDAIRVEVRADIHIDHGCMYDRNGDPGWPPEYSIELEMDEVKVLGQKICIHSCLTDSRLENLEQEMSEVDYDYEED
jgi:hypothetical protein